jgi:hypothetical protein
MWVVEALRTSILEPRDHLHIKQVRALAQGAALQNIRPGRTHARP